MAVIILLALVGLGLLSGPAEAATLYLDPLCTSHGTSYNPATRACTGGTATVRKADPFLTCANGTGTCPTGGGGTCTGSCVASGAYSIPADAFATMVSGDVMYLRGGTYRSPIVIDAGDSPQKVPNGTSWSAPTVISAYPTNRTCAGFPTTLAGRRACYGSTYESVVLNPLGGGSAGSGILHIESPDPNPDPTLPPVNPAPQYLWFEGLHLEALNNTSGRSGINVFGRGGICHRCVVGGVIAGTGPPLCNNDGTTGTCTGTCLPPSAKNPTDPINPKHLLFMNSKVSNTSHQGIALLYRGLDYHLLNMSIENNGKTTLHHGVYAGGSLTIDGGYVTGSSGFGLHLYHAANVCDPPDLNYPGLSVSNMRSFANGISGIVVSGAFAGARIQNNLVYRNVGAGIQFNGASNTIESEVYNNTIVANGDEGIKSSTSRAKSQRYINNIYDRALLLQNAATNAVFLNNYDLCTTCASPDFVNASQDDYRLKSADPLVVNQGANLTAQGVTTDFDGNGRPAGGAFDIGAYEFNSSGPPVQTFDFALTDNVDDEADVSIAQGASAPVILTATHTAGTAAAVTFAAAGVLPPGATLGFSPPTCAPTPTCTTTATLTMANATPSGGYAVALKASAPGISRTTTFDVTVLCE